MSGIKISALTAVPSAQTTDIFPVVQGGVTYKESLAQVQTLFGFSTGILALANGGTNANLTASNGGIFYSTASAGAILAGTATANLPLLSGSTAAPTWGAFAISLGGALTTGGSVTFSGAHTFAATITGNTSVTFPTSGTLATTSNTVLLSPAGNQTITAHDLTLAAGIFTIGAATGGVNGSLILYPNSASVGGFRILNSTVSTYSTTLTNSSIGQASTISIPDPGTATANVVLAPSSLVSGNLVKASGTAGLIVDAGIAAGSLVQWAAASSTPITAAVNTGYYITDASQVTITLPVTAAAGSIVAIVGNGAGGWILAPGAGQTIKVIGSSAGTSITSAEQYDCIEVLCTVANTTWVARSVMSTGLTIV